MVRKLKHPRFLLSSYILGASAAFVSAGVLDYAYFEQAVQSRETAMKRTHRNVLKSHDDYLRNRLSEETQKAHERAVADTADQIKSVSEKLKDVARVAEARQKLLDIKNRQLKELAPRERQFLELEGVVRRLETENEELKGQLASAAGSNTALRGGVRLVAGNEVRAARDSGSLQVMRDEFARQIAAEVEGRKKSKGPVYLNTSRGRVTLAPAR